MFYLRINWLCSKFAQCLESVEMVNNWLAFQHFWSIDKIEMMFYLSCLLQKQIFVSIHIRNK